MKSFAIQSGGNPIRTTKYENFRGVDMTTDSAKIDNSRSPFAPNLIVDSGGFPEKRLGYRTLITLDKPINGLYYVNIKETPMYLIHGGGKLYRWDTKTEPIVLKEGINNAKSVGAVMKEKFWILTGTEYLVYDGETVKGVCELAFIPTTTIARAPTGGGEPYDTVNLLQPKRINKFLANGTDKVYQLDTTEINADLVTATVNEVEKKETTDFTVDRKTGKVTFIVTPPAPTTQVGKDNVVINFSKTVEGYADRILKCSILTTYGIGTNDRIFMSGNPKYQSTDWHSELNDPSYIPDLSYSLIGSENTAIMGYSKIGEYLAIIKENNSQDSTIFLRSGKIELTGSEGDKTATFPLKQGVTGVGALSKLAIGKLMDEPLFLSSNGIYAITSNMITSERTVQNRSYFVDAMLTKEKNLENAIAVEWNGWFIVCINTRCYVLDGKQNKSYKPQSNGDYVYECYHWDNIPAVCFLEHQGTLYFGTAGGKVCKFNSDNPLSRFSDDGEPITCSWSTKADDDGDFMTKKSISKHGSGLMLKPYTRSSCKVTIRTDKDFGKEILTSYMDIFTFDDFSFERFSFNTNDAPQVIPFATKVKNYVTAQVIVTNDVVNEGFGILGIIKRYTTGNFVKR